MSCLYTSALVVKLVAISSSSSLLCLVYTSDREEVTLGLHASLEVLWPKQKPSFVFWSFLSFASACTACSHQKRSPGVRLRPFGAVRMHACMRFLSMFACMRLCMHFCMHACMRLWMHILHACMHACMRLCMHILNACVLGLLQANDLYSDIARVPRDAAIRKLNDFIKRARLAKVSGWGV